MNPRLLHFRLQAVSAGCSGAEDHQHGHHASCGAGLQNFACSMQPGCDRWLERRVAWTRVDTSARRKLFLSQAWSGVRQCRCRGNGHGSSGAHAWKPSMPSQGRRRMRISHSSTPKLYTSLFSVPSADAAEAGEAGSSSSGAQYAAVPMVPVAHPASASALRIHRDVLLPIICKPCNRCISVHVA